MRLILHDFGGYPFTAELARALDTRGHEVHYLYATGFKTPRTALEGGGVRYWGVDPGGRYSPRAGLGRLLHERRYGSRAASLIKTIDPHVVISANTPLSAQSRILQASRHSGAGFAFWLQDIHGVAVSRLLRRRLGPLGVIAGAQYSAFERRLLRASDAVIAIAEDFLPALDRWGVRRRNVTVVENWAPLSDLPVVNRRNDWARRQGLEGRPVLLYAGTLGRKHDPSLLVDLARAIPDATVAVVAEGSGMSTLREGVTPANLRLLSLQPPAELPAVLGSADILVALLDPDAHEFSVPSKVLSYLAAGRPILAAMPSVNLASRVVMASGAGVVVDPNDRPALVAAARGLIADRDDMLRRGRLGRSYAERTFDIGDRAGRIEAVLTRIARQNHVRESVKADTAGAHKHADRD